MTDTVLKVERIGKTIGGKDVLQPCSLLAGQGEIIALCGGNGAGKSTLIRIVAGITQPTRGYVRICGRQWSDDRKQYADSIGYMPDEFLFGSALTAHETMRFYASLRRAKTSHVEELLRAVGLYEVRNRKISTFSKGMRQRLLFAQAMLAKPALLLLDEPTNGLDPFWMDEFGRLIRQAAADGQTVLFSTHQLNIAELYADRALFMDDGFVRHEGEVRALSHQYQNRGGLYGAFQALVAVKEGR